MIRRVIRLYTEHALLIARLIRLCTFGALGGAIGATAGWAIWLALAVVLNDPLTLCIGAGVAAASELAQHVVDSYKLAASDSLRDRQRSSRPTSLLKVATSVRLRSIVVAGATVLLLATGENVLTDLVGSVFVPLVQSVVLYSIVGAVLAPVFMFEPADVSVGDSKIWQLLLLAGILYIPLALLTTSFVRLASLAKSGGPNESGSLTSWWILLLLALTAAFYLGCAGYRLAAVASITMVIFSVGSVWLPLEGVTYNHKDEIPYSSLIAMASDGLVRSPDVPASSWQDAIRRFGNAEGEPVLVEASTISRAASMVATLAGCGRLPEDAQPFRLPWNSNGQSVTDPRIVPYREERRLELCRDLDRRALSNYVRSVIVLAGLLFGLAWMMSIERRLVPDDYMVSAVRRWDSYLAISLVCLLALATVVSRIVG